MNKDAVAAVIGVSKYSRGGIPPDEFALDDAADVRKLLISLGYTRENIIYLENPTEADLRATFGTETNPGGKLRNWAREGRSDVFVYYSGHGASDPESRATYLIPSDADPQRLALTAYPLELLKKNLSAIPARSMTVVIESCFSGLSEAGPLVKEMSPVSVVPKSAMSALEGGVLMTSATGDQVSTWFRPAGHSLFTYYFLKGMNGAADRTPADDRITVAELQAYLEEEVPYRARRAGREQTPYIASADPDRVLARVDPTMREHLAELEKAEAFIPVQPIPRAGSGGTTPGGVEGSGTLYVDSTPSGAQIFVDGWSKGSTPVEIEGIPAGNRKLTLVREGYETLTKIVTLEAGSREIVRETLAEQTGSLKVTTDPPGAALYLDGAYVGAAPLELRDLKVGEHMLRAEQSDYEPQEGKVQVVFQQPFEVPMHLKPKPGRLVVVSTPGEADVWVDGSPVGRTIWHGELPAGEHEIVVGKTGFSRESSRVKLPPNGSETVKVVLRMGSDSARDASGRPPIPAPEPEVPTRSRVLRIPPERYGPGVIEVGVFVPRDRFKTPFTDLDPFLVIRNDSFETSTGYGARLGVFFLRNQELEVDGKRVSTKVSCPVCIPHEKRLTNNSLAFRWSATWSHGQGRFDPFLSLGLGWHRFAIESFGPASTEKSFSAALGFRTTMGEIFNLRGELSWERVLFTPDPLDEYEISLGLGLFLNRR